MGYTRIVPRPHQCPVPWLITVLAAGYGVGTRWVCDDCRQSWVLCGDGYKPTKWESDGFKAADLLAATPEGQTP